jgi:ubiquinone biosynthesis protein
LVPTPPAVTVAPAALRTLDDLGGATVFKRVVAATDGSSTAQRAVEWANALAGPVGAELVLVRVLPPGNSSGTQAGSADATRAHALAVELSRQARELAGDRGRAHVITDSEPAEAIVRVAEEECADVLVVGNAGMAGRKEFLLSNVPNRISHCATCAVLIVNTSNGEGDPIVVRVPQQPRTREGQVDDDPHLLRRATRISAVMARHGWTEVVTRRRGDHDAAVRESARRLRAALEELGPTFCKLGQVLSTRPDLMPPAFIDELAKLQDHVPPVSEEEIVRVMEEELRVPWEDVFESIEPEPLASGTIAQVHRATLTRGDRVVVKVQRPGARDAIVRDLALLSMFAERTARRPGLRQIIDLPAIVDELSESLQRELDFLTEAANLQRLDTALEDYTRLGVPRLYEDYTSQRLLVMQEIPGGPIREAPEGPAREQAARQLLESYYRQVLTDGFFHADPHPGNLLWWDDRIYFLDFGMVGVIGPEVREHLMLLLLAFWQEDVDFLTDVSLMLAGADQYPDVDVSGFRTDLGALMTRYRGLSLREIELGPILQEMTAISLSHGVPLPASMALAAKAMTQMQLATAELDPDLDPFTVAGNFLARNTLERIRSGANVQQVLYRSQKFGTRLLRVIESLERLTGARPGPKLQVQFRGLDGLEANVRRAGRRLSLALVTLGAFGATAITATAQDVGDWMPRSFAVIGGLLLTGLVGDLLRRR